MFERESRTAARILEMHRERDKLLSPFERNMEMCDNLRRIESPERLAERERRWEAEDKAAEERALIPDAALHWMPQIASAVLEEPEAAVRLSAEPNDQARALVMVATRLLAIAADAKRTMTPHEREVYRKVAAEMLRQAASP
jgi:hypothetical protein